MSVLAQAALQSAAPVVPVNILVFFFMMIYMGLITFLAVAFPLAERRFFMGALGKAEYRNQRGIIGIIKSPEGFVGVERMRLRFPGLLQSLGSPPRFGKFFFAGEGAVMKPVAAARVAVIDARSAVAAGPETVALVETLRGNYQSESGAIDARIEEVADQRDKAAEEAAAELARKGGGVKVEPKKSKMGALSKRSAKKGARPVPKVKDYDELAITWAETRYYPTREYARKVPPMDAQKRQAYAVSDPTAFLLWKQSYVEDQLQALLFQAEKDNEMSVMNEIKTGILRKTRVLERYDMEADGLTVKPAFTTLQETRPISKEARLKWLVGVTREFSKDPLAWPVEIGGRATDVSALADFKLSMLGQGQVDDMLMNEANINADEQKNRDMHILTMVIAIVALLGGIALVFYVLTH